MEAIIKNVQIICLKCHPPTPNLFINTNMLLSNTFRNKELKFCLYTEQFCFRKLQQKDPFKNTLG